MKKSLLNFSVISAIIIAVLSLVSLPASARPEIKQVDKAPPTATLIPLSDNWRMDGDVPVHALILSIQGLANRDYPRIYLEYPQNWQWEIVRPLITFLEKRHGIKFERLAQDDADAALTRFGKYAKGCVVWDKAVRSSLIVAFTISGVEDLVIVNEDLLPLALKHGLKPMVDLRGKFTGQTDTQIYQWAYDNYHQRCSRDYYVAMGGHSGAEMQPGIADFGIRQRAFFTNLSADPKDASERALLSRIFAGQNPASIVLGWHSYAKDTEAHHTTLASNYGLETEGLHNLPNVSFTCQIPLTPGFKYANPPNVPLDTRLTADNKVYIAAVSSDSIGIGAWTKPGRGDIPYAWQVTANWSWMNPPALQYFYESKTPNDYLIGGLSGPGYMYPQAIPADKFPALMEDMRALMTKLDLHVVEIMDHTAGHRINGVADLSREVGDRYYKELPDVIGFINGYSAAHTFDLRDTRPLISYDYYLAVDCKVEDAIADLNELMQLNDRRPYFLLIHVRESNTVEKVKHIVEGLDEKAEIVPLDIFLKLAASKKTYETYYQSDSATAKPAAGAR